MQLSHRNGTQQHRQKPEQNRPRQVIQGRDDPQWLYTKVVVTFCEQYGQTVVCGILVHIVTGLRGIEGAAGREAAGCIIGRIGMGW